MKILCHLATLLLLCSCQTNSQSSLRTYTIPKSVKSILFLGNSITYDGRFIEWIDAFYTTHQPDRQLQIRNLGLPSETVSGLTEKGHAGGAFDRPYLFDRLDRTLQLLKPDLVISCYGMNCGIYQKFDSGRFGKFKEGLRKLHQKVSEVGAEHIQLTPPIYEDDSNKAYAEVLERYSQWLLEQRKHQGWKVIDLHGAMKKAQASQRESNPNFRYTADGVHPTTAGHLLMAKIVLQNLGENISEPSSTEFNDLQLNTPKAQEILKLTQQKQRLLKDAWLTHIGHKRPQMPTGLPLERAQQQAIKLQTQALRIAEKPRQKPQEKLRI